MCVCVGPGDGGWGMGDGGWGVGPDRSDGRSVVALHLYPVHHLQHRINTHMLPDRENNTTPFSDEGACL